MEAYKHSFREARKVIKDFTLLDLIYMVPKLQLKIQNAVFHVQSSDPKARAAGYNHMYFDNTNINVANLRTYPTDEDLKCAADKAAQEADSLLALLGLVPGQLHCMQKSKTAVLSSIDSWFKMDNLANHNNDIDASESSDDEWSDSVSLSEAQELQNLLDHKEDQTLLRTRKQDEELLNLTCLAMAILADKAIEVYVLLFC